MTYPKTLLAYLISKMEGFGIPNAIPTLYNNPGDLRHSPHSYHDAGNPNGIGKIDTIEHGWEDLELQLQQYANESLTLEDMVKVYLGIPANEDISGPNPDHNNGVVYLNYLCQGLHMTAYDWVSSALKINYIGVVAPKLSTKHLEEFIMEHKKRYDEVSDTLILNANINGEIN